MAARSVFQADEQTSPIYSFQMTDSADDTNIDEASLLTLKLTYYNIADSAIINSRSLQDINDTNDGNVSTTGLVTWRITTADTVIVDTTAYEVNEYEKHRARFDWTYTSSDATTKTGRDEVDFHIRNLNLIT